MTENVEDITIKFSGDYCIYEIEEKFNAIDFSWMNSKTEKIVVDLNDIESYDGTFFQLLMMLKNSAISVGKDLLFEIADDHEILSDAENLLIRDYLGI